MIGTIGAAVLFVANLLCAVALAVLAGGLTCAILGRPWRAKEILSDTVLATVVAVGAIVIVSEIDMAHHGLKSRVWLIWALTAASAVLRNLTRLLLSDARLNSKP